MEPLNLSVTGSTIHIEDYPDGVKVVQVSGPLVRRAADLALHCQDLRFAVDCLKALEGQAIDLAIGQVALWDDAILRFLKCFGCSKSRSQLSSDKIYRGNPLALEAFAYFDAIRNKHLVHDENSYTQAIPGAIINGGGRTYKVEKIVFSLVTAPTPDPNNYGNLKRLVDDALAWAVAEFDTLCSRISADLEAVPHPELLARDSIQHDTPRVEDISRPRQR